MKWKEFNETFPDFYRSQFNVNSKGDVLFRNYINIDSKKFWGNKEYVKMLNLSAKDFSTYLSNPLHFHKSKKTWEPEEWSFNSDSSPPMIKLTHPKDIDLQSFRVYVNEKDFFVHKDSFLDFSDIDAIDFKDERNDYCVVLKAM